MLIHWFSDDFRLVFHKKKPHTSLKAWGQTAIIAVERCTKPHNRLQFNIAKNDNQAFFLLCDIYFQDLFNRHDHTHYN